MTDKDRQTGVKTMPLIMDPETWMEVNAAVKKTTGETASEVASRSPATAYGLIREGLLELLDQSYIGQGRLPEGPEFQQAKLFLPEHLDAETEIQVKLFETMDDVGRELPRTPGRASEVILSFTVEPPIDLMS